MAKSTNQTGTLTGIGLALIAVIVWSGNFVVARGVIHDVPPGTLAFFRWLTGTLILLPFAWKQTKQHWTAIRQSIPYLLITALSGITLFNTFVYIAAHYTTAINLSLIGTTSSPVMALILARIFLKEKLDSYKLWGVALCLSGVLFLLAGGDWTHLWQLQFTRGDGWVLLAAFSFAVYNILARRKPAGIPPLAFLMVLFAAGTVMLIPFLFWDRAHFPPVKWTPSLWWIVLYLGVGTSVISFLCWNRAISALGAGRTALFGNLIPVFSSLEAALFLGERFGWIHLVSMLLVFAGIVLANWKIVRSSFIPQQL